MSEVYQKSSSNGLENFRVIDLRSDTMTVPTDKMRKAMMEAEVGDDVYGEDPTVNKLEKTAAELLGKEAALFLPCGTMGNLLAIMVHCDKRGSGIIAGDWSHIYKYEQGTPAQIAGVSVQCVPNLPDGTFSIESLIENIKVGDLFDPITQLVTIEQTHCMAGGKALPLDWIEEMSKVCKERKVATHMDGARVFNAAEYLQVPVARVVRDVDSVSFCLSKALCCPMGSLLCGTKKFIDVARRTRKALGGGLRQVGFLAGPGLCALDTIVPLLGDDQRHTRELAVAIDNLKSSIFQVDVEGLHTNILMINVLNNPKNLKAQDLRSRLIEVKDNEVKNGICDSDQKPIAIKSSCKDLATLRIIFYHQINDELTQLSIKKIVYAIKDLEK